MNRHARKHLLRVLDGALETERRRRDLQRARRLAEAGPLAVGLASITGMFTAPGTAARADAERVIRMALSTLDASGAASSVSS